MEDYPERFVEVPTGFCVRVVFCYVRSQYVDHVWLCTPIGEPLQEEKNEQDE